MKKIHARALFLTIALVVLPASAAARDQFSLGIQANRSAVEVFGEAAFAFAPSTFYAGASGLYYEDRYAIASIHAMIGNVIRHGFTGKLGFRGYGGEFTRSSHSNPDLYGAAFSVSGHYDLSDVIASRYVPVILHGTFSFSPKPLSFNDTERIFEAILAADWKFLENAAITAGFRYLDVKFDHWDKSHGSGYLGFKFIFH